MGYIKKFEKWCINKLTNIENYINSNIKSCKHMNKSKTKHKSQHNITHGTKSKLLVMFLISTQANINKTSAHTITFDTDSQPIGVDNRCTACISHNIDDFVGVMKDTKRRIKGFGGTHTPPLKQGTLRWKWCDDKGMKHIFIIPNSYYAPEGGVRLLSPQHWAKTQSDTKPIPGTGETTNHNECKLFWKQGKHTLHIPLSTSTNVATFYLAPGYNKFMTFCTEAEAVDQDNDPIASPIQIIPPEDDEINDDDKIHTEYEKWIPKDNDIHIIPNDNHEEVLPPTMGILHNIIPRGITTYSPKKKTRFNMDLTPSLPTKLITKKKPSNKYKMVTSPRTFNIDNLRPIPTGHECIPVTENTTSHKTIMAEYLDMHNKFQHISFKRLREMSKQGIIPRKYKDLPFPTCYACLYAKATRKRTREKGNQIKQDVANTPGAMVSVDQLISPTPGLIAQMTGILATKRYTCATIFVDQFSRLGYVHLQKTTSGVDTVQGKQAFEQYAKDKGVTIQGYCADNGIFKENKWVHACKNNLQTLKFAAVGAHHQNGHAERRIRELQDLARTMLIHANKRWKTTITTNLWPYAIRMANEVLNNTPSMQDKARRSPLQIFTNKTVAVNPKH